MTNDDPLKNWQLENQGESPEQWKLLDTEQEVGKHMQLQPAEVSGPQWQPVEYRRETRPSRNWVLPSIVIVALLAVLGYVGWIAFGQMGGALPNLGPLVEVLTGQPLPGSAAIAPVATPTQEVLAAAIATEVPATPTALPTEPPIAEPTATFTPEPTPIAMAELVTGTVNTAAGVNARTQPTITGALVRLLNQGDLVTVVGQEGDWLQVILADNIVAWVSGEFIAQVAQQVTRDELNTRRVAAGLPLLPAPEVAPAPATPAPAAAITQTVAVTQAAAMPVLVNGEPFINARSSPTTTAPVVTTVNVSATLVADGRTPGGDWLRVQLPDGAVAWVVTTFVTPEGDINTLPVVEATEPTAEAPAAATAETVPVTETATLTEPLAEVTATPEIAVPAGAAIATVANLVGAKVRAAPDQNLDEIVVAKRGETFSALGRSADALWVQVQLADGTPGWILATAITLDTDINALPVAP